MPEILIIGGGASGMAAAVSASGDKDNRVTLLERQARTGRKLLSTGNGRCNLTNTGAAPERYQSVGEGPGTPRAAGPDPEAALKFAAPALRRFGVRETLAFFGELGLATATEEGGRVYPLSGQANSVADLLRFALDAGGVRVLTGRPALGLSRKNGRFIVETAEGALPADQLAVACGGAAGAKVGGVSDGYALLESLGHSRTRLYPALTQIKTEPEYPRALKGVKSEAAVKVLRGKEILAESAGEILFAEYGVSGPAAFDVSRAAALGGEGLDLALDLLPGFSADEVHALLVRRVRTFPGLTAEDLLTGVLHNRLGRMVCKYAGLGGSRPLPELRPAELLAVSGACKAFTLKIRGVSGFDMAQVTAGGIRTSEFDPGTLESRICPGLFACGEVLDIDGACGGYNLQWAWSSGLLAGRLGT